jgi:hypothetical protein
MVSDRRLNQSLITIHISLPLPSPPMLGLIIVHDQTGVNYSGNPAEEREENAQNKTQDAARHQDRDRREDDAKKVAERFQGQRRVACDM